jgi:D-glycero-D-manno-heptose 1,7-bisphosphate phosphatase
MSETTARAIVLDRDGVINRDSREFIKTPDEWHPLPGSIDAIARLTAADFRICVATNQSGIGRGLIQHIALENIHDKMRTAVTKSGGRIDHIEVCPHLPDAGCDCRKPAAGMFAALEKKLGFSLAGMPAVGDSERDLLAAESAGAQAVLVLTGNGSVTATTPAGSRALNFADLAAVADYFTLTES